MRAVRLADSVFVDIHRQLPPDRVEDFLRHDLKPVLDSLGEQAEVWARRRKTMGRHGA